MLKILAKKRRPFCAKLSRYRYWTPIEGDRINLLCCNPPVRQAYRRTNLTVDAHIEKLREKHDKISKAVEQAQRAPGVTDFEIAEMKKEKLRLKEEITRLNA